MTPMERFRLAGQWWNGLPFSERRIIMAQINDNIPGADRGRSEGVFSELMFATRLALLKLYEEAK